MIPTSLGREGEKRKENKIKGRKKPKFELEYGWTRQEKLGPERGKREQR